ncbi:MAG: sigma-70 family RNA polymerase sigma factor [Acidobacteria bacterium]|nr:sigma-70 family RNA polymerase sigma factor [Acidobacteriota bacterium]
MRTKDAASGGATAGGQPDPGRSVAANDGELIRRVAGGDAAALADLYDRHAGAVFSLGLRIVRDEAEAGRVVEQVFTYVWQQASRYDPARASVAGWLLATARGASIDRVRAAPRGVATAAESTDGGAAPAPGEMATLLLPSPAGTQGYDVCSAEEADRLRGALAELPALQRLAIELAYFEGLTPGEIAAQLEQTTGTINDRLLTGLQSLRTALEDGTA